MSTSDYPWWAPIASGLAAWVSTTATRWLRDRRRMASKKQHPSQDPPVPLQSEQTFPSTTWEWRKVKMARPPEATRHSAPKGRSLRALPRRNRRDPLPVTVKLRGGPESWVELHARGSILRVPGWVSISDVVDMLNSHF